MKFVIATTCLLSAVLIGSHAMNYDELEKLAAKCQSDVICVAGKSSGISP